MKKSSRKAGSYSIFFRYIILVLAAVNNLWIFYAIFTPLTVYPVFYILNLFFNASLLNTTIILEGFSIQLIKACIAGSAYYLLLILNLTTPMPIKKRILSIIFSFLAFLAVNIIRILLFSMLLLKSFSLFNTLHLIFWYLLSGIIVFLIWFAEIKIFRIKTIPVYSDIRNLISLISYSKIKKK